MKLLKTMMCGVLFLAGAAAGFADDAWDRFVPPPDSKFDWIQLKSGEWLKGDLKAMYDYSVEFESDELDTLEFDLDDVKQLRTRNSQRVLVELGRRDMDVMNGVLEMNGDNVVLRDGDEVTGFKRNQLVSIAPDVTRELGFWSGNFSIGITARGGNTDTMDASTIANIQRRSAISRFNTDYLANFSKTQDGKTADNQRLSGYYDWFLTSRFYWQIISGEYYRDPFSNIAGQYSLSTGIGRDLVRTSRAEWRVTTGVGYQQLEASSVQAGEDNQSSSPFFSAGTRWDYEVTSNIDYLFDYTMRILNKDNGQYTHHLLTTLSVDFVKDFDLDISIVWDRIQEPQRADDGTLPSQDDYQFIVGLAYDF